MTYGPKPRDPAVRLWAKVDKEGPIPAHRPELGPCWIWKGSKTPRGYGNIGVGSLRDGSRTMVPTHRLAYELVVGPIPDGLELDHLCRNPPCCNPGHLEPVSHLENVRRAGNAQKTACRHGHPFDATNTYITLNGRRHCRACGRNHAFRKYRKEAGIAVSVPRQTRKPVSERQDVIALLVQGLPHREIAQAAGVSPAMVAYIKRKLKTPVSSSTSVQQEAPTP